jgi:hypothetical protein
MTFTPSPIATATPAFAVAPEDKPVMGPVPAKAGDPICVSFPSAPDNVEWEIFNIAGELVARASTAGSSHCLQSRGLVPNIYIVKLKVKLANGETRETMQPIVIQ